MRTAQIPRALFPTNHNVRYCLVITKKRHKSTREKGAFSFYCGSIKIEPPSTERGFVLHLGYNSGYDWLEIAYVVLIQRECLTNTR